MSMRTNRRVKAAATVAGAGVLVMVGATASASIPSSSGTIYGCYAKANGATRIIDPARQKCSGTENPISWDQRGPRGPQGPKGDTGAPGAPGVSGYEVVHTTYLVTLPTAHDYFATCSTGKHVLGGGGIVQLSNDSGPSGYGTPQYSVPQPDGSGWVLHVEENGTGTNPNATITVRATCALTGP